MSTAVSSIARASAFALALLVSLPAVSEAATLSRASSRELGNRRFGGSLRRSVVASHAGTSGSISCSTTLNARLLGRTYRVAGVVRRVSGARLGGRASTTRRFQLELIGRGTVSIGASISRSISIRTFEVPVPVGPFTVTVEGSAGLTLSLRGSVGASRGSVSVGLEGSASIGGSVGVGVGVPGARVGVEGSLTLLRAALPASCTMRRGGVTVDVSFVVSSNVDVGVFAKVGVGPFSKKWTVDVPFLSFVIGERRYTIATRTLRG
jgi:hypothetical protein